MQRNIAIAVKTLIAMVGCLFLAALNLLTICVFTRSMPGSGGIVLSLLVCILSLPILLKAPSPRKCLQRLLIGAIGFCFMLAASALIAVGRSMVGALLGEYAGEKDIGDLALTLVFSAAAGGAGVVGGIILIVLLFLSHRIARAPRR